MAGRRNVTPAGGEPVRVRSAAAAAKEMRGPSPQVSGQDLAAQAAAQSDMDYDTALALSAAREGDDSQLLPYQPTPSINPPRPRTLAAGYDPNKQILRVRFRDGAIYEYYGVPPRVWRNFKRVKSPGRAINRVLNNYSYARVGGT